ncbi:pentapeptide repeat-containing protein [Streptomyces zhihengii]|uniref:pentapeptide repeat-containing protein n=1 Tax=Streptomyces zhihengii TaxID=1818004 RepID=UPI0034561734
MVAPFDACLAHLTGADRTSYLNTLTPGSDLDHCGTTISQTLLEELLAPLQDPITSRVRIGTVQFHEATFTGAALFEGAIFTGDTWFMGATFTEAAWFAEATFMGDARFDGATFTTDARFHAATFSKKAWFDTSTFTRNTWFVEATFVERACFNSATFKGAPQFSKATFKEKAYFAGATFARKVWFDEATFATYTSFQGATFTGEAWFEGAMFAADVAFNSAVFETAPQLGPLVCADSLTLSGARFGRPMTIEAAAARLVCQRTRWDSTAAVRLRYATVDLSDAVFEYPISVTARQAPFTTLAGRQVEEHPLANGPGVAMESLRGVDAAHLVLHDVDMSRCLLSGTVHLDQLRMEGECPLAPAPRGLSRHGLLPVRWTARRTLAEEQHWREAGGSQGWTPAPDHLAVVGPAQLATVYRQLRKSFEDSKNEPDAADFYYGEMEMRRHDRNRPGTERALLAVYWAVSGYGLRASRAVGWLLGAMAVTVLVMMLWGLPQADPKPVATGKLVGQRIQLTTDKPAPVNPEGSLHSRLTSERWEKSLRVVVNSSIFRSSGQDLTTAGTYTEMASRLAEPLLLGLAVLAVRGRVKR